MEQGLDDFRIHYLNGQIEVELILPFSLSEQPVLIDKLRKQCKRMTLKVQKINNIILFFKQDEE